MKLRHLIVVLAMSALAACGKGDKDKAGGDTAATGSAPAAAAGGGGGGGDIDAFMKLDTDKAAAFAVGGKDCVAKAKSVGDWRNAHTADYKAMQKKLSEQWPGGKPPQDVQDKYGPTMKANKSAVMSAMLDCSNDAAFSKMMDESGK